MASPSPDAFFFERARTDAEVFDLLQSLARDMSFRKTPAFLLDQALGRVVKILHAEAASLFLLNEETGLLDFKIVKGLNAQALRELDTHLKPGEGLAGWVFTQGQSAVVNEPGKDPRFMPGVDWLTGFKTRNILAVPLRLGGNPFGVLEVVNRRKKEPFTDDDARLLEVLGRLLVTPLDNLRALSALENSQVLLKSLMENIPDAFLAVDPRQRVTHVNAAAAALFRLDAVPLGRPWAELLGESADLGAALAQALSGEKRRAQQSLHLTLSGGVERKFLGTIFPLLTAGQTPQGAGILLQAASG